MRTFTRQGLIEAFDRRREDKANADARKLVEMEDADPTLSPLLVRIMTEFMHSKPLPK